MKENLIIIFFFFRIINTVKLFEWSIFVCSMQKNMRIKTFMHMPSTSADPYSRKVFGKYLNLQ